MPKYLVQATIPNFFEVELEAPNKQAARLQALSLPPGEWGNYYTPKFGQAQPTIVNVEQA